MSKQEEKVRSEKEKKESSVLSDILNNKKLIFTLAKNDFKTRFSGSYLGTIWAFIQPVVTVVVYWFVFQVGFRAGSNMSYPYVLWLMCGLIPWFYISEAISGGTNALLEYSYLVKKVVFKITILPTVKVLASIFTHLFFVVLVLIIASCYGFYPDVYTLQVLYYLVCSFVLMLGITYFTSSIVVFFRDLTPIVNIILQVGVWATPIMWVLDDTLHGIWNKIFKLNPFYYIVSGFRDAILNKHFFWESPLYSIYFWCFTLVMLFVGTTVFKKLKVHFADVL